MRSVVLLLAAAGCFSKPGRPGGEPGDAVAYDVAFDATGFGTLTGFPALVPLAPAIFDYAGVEDPKTDLRFVDPDDGSEIPFDVDEWNPTGESLVWVRVPEIRGGSIDDGVRLDVGPGISQARPAETWQDYEAVWHLSSASQSYPSAVGTYVGTGDQVGDGAGQLGRGAVFAGATQSSVMVSGGANLFDAWNEFTLEVWLNTSPAAGEPVFLDPQNGGGPVHGCRMLEGPLRTQCDIQFAGGTTFQDVGVDSGQWAYVVYTADGQQQAAYGNGMREAIETITPPLGPATDQIQLGGFNALDGMLDEVRISKTGRSADYVAAQYRSMIRAFATVTRVP